ncbi:hypothetical protein EV424DRAFT_1570860 [Suillus variegatus]|nr:hypothetical protein EV424DRAFT_1570860 [Suillus variegatus]
MYLVLAEVLQQHNLSHSRLLVIPSPSSHHLYIITHHLAPNTGPQRSEGGLHPNGTAHRHDDGPSAALLDKVRALDALPRLGALRTLDLRGNDLRNGVTYLAHVLKRNRTLKVLNFSENKLDVQCLVAIAEALRRWISVGIPALALVSKAYIQSLRAAFTLNNALKRLLISSTNLTSPGAIALAEFLPESNSLLHLDLTDNNLDIAAIMALSSGLKANHTMQCLDVNIPPDDEEFARMCREIINTCGGLKNNAEIISRAYTLLSQIETSVNSPRSISVASSGASSPTLVSPTDQDLVQQVKATVDEEVQTTTDVVLLEELQPIPWTLQMKMSPMMRTTNNGIAWSRGACLLLMTLKANVNFLARLPSISLAQLSSFNTKSKAISTISTARSPCSVFPCPSALLAEVMQTERRNPGPQNSKESERVRTKERNPGPQNSKEYERVRTKDQYPSADITLSSAYLKAQVIRPQDIHLSHTNVDGDPENQLAPPPSITRDIPPGYVPAFQSVRAGLRGYEASTGVKVPHLMPYVEQLKLIPAKVSSQFDSVIKPKWNLRPNWLYTLDQIVHGYAQRKQLR